MFLSKALFFWGGGALTVFRNISLKNKLQFKSKLFSKINEENMSLPHAMTSLDNGAKFNVTLLNAVQVISY